MSEQKEIWKCPYCGETYETDSPDDILCCGEIGHLFRASDYEEAA